MNKNNKSKSMFVFKPFDTLFLFFSSMFVLGSLFIVSAITPPAGESWEIRYDSKVIRSGSLSINTEIVLEESDYSDLLGQMIIEVNNGKIRIKQETSPNNVCSNQGWTDNTYKVLICEPNNIMVLVIKDAPEFEIPEEIPPGGLD